MRLFLNSLKFPELNARRNKIDCSISDTFEWIFDRELYTADMMAISDESDVEREMTMDESQAEHDKTKAFILPYDSASCSSTSGTESDDSFDVEIMETQARNFLEWLKADKQLFWITGKPASGKSTLMKFILSHNETGRLLKK